MHKMLPFDCTMECGARLPSFKSWLLHNFPDLSDINAKISASLTELWNKCKRVGMLVTVLDT